MYPETCHARQSLRGYSSTAENRAGNSNLTQLRRTLGLPAGGSSISQLVSGATEDVAVGESGISYA